MNGCALDCRLRCRNSDSAISVAEWIRRFLLLIRAEFDYVEPRDEWILLRIKSVHAPALFREIGKVDRIDDEVIDSSFSCSNFDWTSDSQEP